MVVVVVVGLHQAAPFPWRCRSISVALCSHLFERRGTAGAEPARRHPRMAGHAYVMRGTVVVDMEGGVVASPR